MLGVQIVREYVNNKDVDKIILEKGYVDYSSIKDNYYEEMYLFWYSNGVKNGMKIGLCLDKNELFMLIVLSLDMFQCEVEFQNKDEMIHLIKRNSSRCHCIVTDKEILFETNQKKRKVKLWGKYDIYIYFFETSYQMGSDKSYIYFTSGSTGIPKAFYKFEDAIISEGRAIKERLNLDSNQSILCVAPCSHVFAQSIACIAAFLAKAKVRYMNNLTSPNRIIQELSSEKYTMLVTTPLYLEYLSDYPEAMEKIQKIVTGGSRLSSKATTSIKNIFNFYGSTETGVIAIRESVDANDSLCVGNIVPTVKVKFEKSIENKDGYDLKTIRIISSFNAYQCQKENEKYFFGNEGILLNDYGCLKNDNLYIYGRIDNIVNINGLKVSCDEVQELISKCDNVLSVKVERAEKEKYEYIVAYVEFERLSEHSISDLYKILLNTMEHSKIPQKIVAVDGFEHTITGKKKRGKTL